MSQTVTINSFYGGVANDKRDPTSSEFSYSAHFDVVNNPYKLQPERGYVVDETFDSGGKTDNLTRFTTIGSTLYALGKTASGSKPIIYKKASATLSSNWTQATGGTDATSGTVNKGVFLWFNSLLLGLQGGTNLWSFDLTTFTKAYKAVTYNNSREQADPLVHRANHKAYFPIDNTVYELDTAGTWTNVLTLSTDHVISNVDQKGVYLLILLAPSNKGDHSYLAYWDVTSSDTQPQEVLDLGEGSAQVVGQADGEVTVAQQIGEASLGNLAMSIRVLSGGDFKELKRISLLDDSTNEHSITGYKTYFGKNLGFVVTSSGVGTDLSGVWVVGRKNTKFPLSVSLDRHLPVTSIQGVYSRSDIVYLAHSNDGSIKRSELSASFGSSPSSVYATLFNHGMTESEKVKEKQLEAVAVGFEPLPASATVGLKYKTESDATWQDFPVAFSATDDNSVVLEQTPSIKAFRDIAFQASSTNGAVITKLAYRFKTNQTKI